MPRLARASCLPLALCALAAHATPTLAQRGPSTDTATYASPALAALVDAAARDNRVPDALRGYHASVESEVALAVRRDDGVEAVLGVEQIASTLEWTRDGTYDQHVVGYRARQAAPGASMLSVLRTGWIAPVLYGDRLFAPREPARERVRDSTARRRRIGGRRDGLLVAVHPFARDRERYYRFSGGDTVVTLRAPGGEGTRAIPIVRLHVEPRPGVARRDQLLFRGDVDLDAVRHVVVRMRGNYVVPVSTLGGARGRIARAALQGYAFIEYETAERDGAFWLPAYQRIEFQGGSPVLGDARGVVRIVSRLRDVVVNDTALQAPLVAADGRWRLTRAGGDTIDRFDGWRAPLGGVAAALHADDFDDVAPDAWGRSGAPRTEFYAARPSDLVHFDRVEGLFTGAGTRLRLRDAAPGVTLRVVGGWAWAEETARGRVELEKEWTDRTAVSGQGARAPGQWTATLRALRSLDLTNDFRDPLDSGSSLGALLGSLDDYDYVDRRLATLAIRRAFAGRAAVLRVESGLARDDGASRHVTRGLTGRDAFRPNRGVDAGRYARTTAALELHPDVAAEFVRPGVGARILYERGDGDLAYQRAEVRVVGRVEVPVRWPGTLRGSTLTAVARGDAGLVTGDALPPQQLFELGGVMSLRGYDYKTFAGDRATLARGALVYGSPWLRAPIRVGRLVFPGVAPGASIGVESGATAVRSDAARRAIARLGPADGEPISRPSGGPRTTIDVGLRFFGGALFVGGARPIDHHADRRNGWRVGVGTGVSF